MSLINNCATKILIGLITLIAISALPFLPYVKYLLTVPLIFLCYRCSGKFALAWTAIGIYSLEKAWFYGDYKLLKISNFPNILPLAKVFIDDNGDALQQAFGVSLYLIMLSAFAFSILVFKLLNHKFEGPTSKLLWCIFLFAPMFDHVGACLHWVIYYTSNFTDLLAFSLFLGAVSFFEDKKELASEVCIILAVMLMPCLILPTALYLSYCSFKKKYNMRAITIFVSLLIFAVIFKSNWLYLSPADIINGLFGISDRIQIPQTRLLIDQYQYWIAGKYSTISFISSKGINLLALLTYVILAICRRDDHMGRWVTIIFGLHIAVFMSPVNTVLLHFAWLMNTVLTVDLLVRINFVKRLFNILDSQEEDMKYIS